MVTNWGYHLQDYETAPIVYTYKAMKMCTGYFIYLFLICLIVLVALFPSMSMAMYYWLLLLLSAHVYSPFPTGSCKLFGARWWQATVAKTAKGFLPCCPLVWSPCLRYLSENHMWCVEHYSMLTHCLQTYLVPIIHAIPYPHPFSLLVCSDPFCLTLYAHMQAYCQ